MYSNIPWISRLLICFWIAPGENFPPLSKHSQRTNSRLGGSLPVDYAMKEGKICHWERFRNKQKLEFRKGGGMSGLSNKEGLMPLTSIPTSERGQTSWQRPGEGDCCNYQPTYYKYWYSASFLFYQLFIGTENGAFGAKAPKKNISDPWVTLTALRGTSPALAAPRPAVEMRGESAE